MANGPGFSIAVFVCMTAVGGIVSQAQQLDRAALPGKTVRLGSAWTVPGIRAIDGRMPASHRRLAIDGITVDETEFRPKYDMSLHHPGDVVLLAFQKDGDVLLMEQELIAESVRIFSAACRRFCIVSKVSPYTYDERSNMGGVAGARFDLAFYDEDGDGRFGTLEPASSLLGSPVWKPRLPNWVKGR